MNLQFPSTDAIYKTIEDLYGIGERRPASPAGHEAERYLLERYKAHGLTDCRLETYPHNYWAPDAPSLRLELNGERIDVPCFFIPTTQFTPPEGLRAETVYIAPDQPFDAIDVEGKIVVFDQVFGVFPEPAFRGAAMHEYKVGEFSAVDKGPQPWFRLNFNPVSDFAESHGALGVIGLLSAMPYDTDRYYAPYEGRYRKYTGIWIRPSQCDTVRRYAQHRATATIVLTGEDTPSETSNVVGVLPGKTDECIVISSHHDSPFRSAVEDASGMAVVLALAETFGSAGPGVLNKTLVFLGCAAHFGLKGCLEFVKRHHADLIPKCALSLHVEHIAKECANVDGTLTETGRPQLRVIFTSNDTPAIVASVNAAIESENLERTLILPATNPLTGPVFPADGWAMHAAGVPTVNYITGPIYLLNEEDTLDKIDRGELVPVTKALAHIIQTIDAIPLSEIKRPEALILGPDGFDTTKLEQALQAFEADRGRAPNRPRS